MKKNKNCFYNKFILDDYIYFESEIFKHMIPKYIKLNEIIFYSEPKFIEVNNIQIIVDYNMFNETKIYKINAPNYVSIEPIFIKTPDILETYYSKKNIKFKTTSTQASEDIINKIKNDILKIQLNYHKDEIKQLNF